MGHVKDRWYSGKGDARKPSTRHGKGLRWQVWYQVDGREKCGGSFKVKAVAERKLVELESSVIRGQWVDPTDQTTVTELVRGHAASRMHKPRTAARTESMIRNHIEGTPLGARRIVAVRPSEVQTWVSDRAQVMAPRTLRLLVTTVRGAFNAAVLDHLVPASPFQRIALPRIERERIVPLTVEQVLAIVEAIGERYRAMVITQAGLGLRIGELLALRTEDIDFLRRMVRIEYQVDRISRELVAPKTARSRRTIPLPGIVSVALAEHMRAHPPADSGLLFHTRDGRPIMHDWYGNKVFVPAAVKAGLTGATSHALRHHYASVLLAAGESVIAVAERLGHDDASLVLSTYGHLLPDMEDHTRRAVDNAWNAVTDSSGESPTAQGRPR
ncbi:MAG: tyrosine-type recombinase/integrase [Pseudonocardia sp.]